VVCRAQAVGWIGAVVCCLFAGQISAATPPSEKLFPDTTKGYLAIPDVDELRNKFDLTQLGQLAADPAMKPFADDLKKQLKERLSRQGVTIGITWDDLDGVYGGEVAIALIQPNLDKKLHALALTCDTTGHADEAKKLLAKLHINLVGAGGNDKGKGAKKSLEKFEGVDLLIYNMPPRANEQVGRKVIYVYHDDLLLACDDLDITKEIVTKLNAKGAEKGSLAAVESFGGAMLEVKGASGAILPHAKWWIEPFGYGEVVRAANGGKKKRGKDMLQILHDQGFSALQGIGGFITFSTGEHEILHRTFIYAPAVKGAMGAEKYLLAARMLQFPNGAEQAPQPWIPRDAATYLSVNFKVKEAFEYSSTLVDAIAGDKDVFTSVLESLKKDKKGPRIDLREELVAFAGERVSLCTDYVLPITTKSERFMVAIEVTDVVAVRKAVAKLMKADPNARAVDTKKLGIPKEIEIWEIVNEDEPEADLPNIMVDGPGETETKAEEEPKEEEKETAFIPNSAITVIPTAGGKGGYLIASTHVDFLVKLLHSEKENDKLNRSGDLAMVNEALRKIVAPQESMRLFSRSDESLRPTYELMKQGKMPEAETMFAKLLNRMLNDDPDNKAPRKQLIDGTKLPDFQIARRYLGPAGIAMESKEKGWLLSGVLLTKDGAAVELAREPAEKKQD